MEWCNEVEVGKETWKRMHKNIILLLLYAYWVYTTSEVTVTTAAK